MMRNEQANKTLETNRRPATPLEAWPQFGRAVHARPCISGGSRSALGMSAHIDILRREAEKLSRPCLDLVPAERGNKVVAHWGGRRSDLPDKLPDFVTALKSSEHFMSVDQSVLEGLGFKTRAPLALCMTTICEDEERLDNVNVSTGRINEVSFKGSIPLTAQPATSIPPLDAVLLYGGAAVQDWLSSQGLERWEYDLVAPEVRDEYSEFFYPLNPLHRDEPPFARAGGWHIPWPDDYFYIPREMQLMIWTFRDAEPWYEVFLSPLGNCVTKTRIT